MIEEPGSFSGIEDFTDTRTGPDANKRNVVLQF